MTTILVIDDETHVLQNVREILELENYDVLLAEDGLKGVALARENHPALVICDVVMPVFDGFMLLQQLRFFPETSQIPLLFITGFRNNPIVKHILDRGESACLFKPFTIDALLSAVHETLSAETS